MRSLFFYCKTIQKNQIPCLHYLLLDLNKVPSHGEVVDAYGSHRAVACSV